MFLVVVFKSGNNSCLSWKSATFFSRCDSRLHRCLGSSFGFTHGVIHIIQPVKGGLQRKTSKMDRNSPRKPIRFHQHQVAVEHLLKAGSQHRNFRINKHRKIHINTWTWNGFRFWGTTPGDWGLIPPQQYRNVSWFQREQVGSQDSTDMFQSVFQDETTLMGTSDLTKPLPTHPISRKSCQVRSIK